MFFRGFLRSVLSYFSKKSETYSFPENACKRASACLSKKERLELSKKKIFRIAVTTIILNILIEIK